MLGMKETVYMYVPAETAKNLSTVVNVTDFRHSIPESAGPSGLIAIML